jgi:hypothetical protein
MSPAQEHSMVKQLKLGNIIRSVIAGLIVVAIVGIFNFSAAAVKAVERVPAIDAAEQQDHANIEMHYMEFIDLKGKVVTKP